MKNFILNHKIIIVRIFARIFSSIPTAFFLLMIIGEPSEHNDSDSFVGILVVGFAVLFLLNCIIALMNEHLGGLLLIINSLAFAVFIYLTSGSNRLLASTLISLPFLLSGILFLISSKLSKQPKNP